MIVHRILDERFAFERNNGARVTEIHCSPSVVRTILMETDPLKVMDFGSKIQGTVPPKVNGADWFEDGHMTGETWRFVAAPK